MDDMQKMRRILRDRDSQEEVLPNMKRQYIICTFSQWAILLLDHMHSVLKNSGCIYTFFSEQLGVYTRGRMRKLSNVDSKDIVEENQGEARTELSHQCKRTWGTKWDYFILNLDGNKDSHDEEDDDEDEEDDDEEDDDDDDDGEDEEEENQRRYDFRQRKTVVRYQAPQDGKSVPFVSLLWYKNQI